MKCISYSINFSAPEETYVQVPFLTNEILSWLETHDGYGEYSRGGQGIYFTSEKDAVLFALRWGA
jgi:hypothetical protein